MPTILLIDNGSSRPGSTVTLRRLAAALSQRIGTEVHPVSLQHANKVPAAELEGRPAWTLEPFLRARLAAGEHDFVAVPLFFGPSRALSRFVPETAATLEDALDPCRIRVAPELCPLPPGEPRLVEIIADHCLATATAQGIQPTRVVLVDHGSPIPGVTAVRRWIADGLTQRLGPGVVLDQAVMERRPGAEYAFNGDLLETVLNRLGETDPEAPVILAMLFLAPGRHAGAGGDICEICAAAESAHPGLRIHPTPLVAEHPLLSEILADRADRVIKSFEFMTGDARPDPDLINKYNPIADNEILGGIN